MSKFPLFLVKGKSRDEFQLNMNKNLSLAINSWLKIFYMGCKLSGWSSRSWYIRSLPALKLLKRNCAIASWKLSLQLVDIFFSTCFCHAFAVNGTPMINYCNRNWGTRIWRAFRNSCFYTNYCPCWLPSAVRVIIHSPFLILWATEVSKKSRARFQKRRKIFLSLKEWRSICKPEPWT